MDFGELMNANPGGYFEAAGEFTRSADKARDNAVDYWTKVVQQLNDTSRSGLWGGPAANAAQRPMIDLQLALNRAADQLEVVPRILADHAEQLADLQKRLAGIVEYARASGVQVSSNGAVTVSEEVALSAAEAGRPNPGEAVVEDINRVVAAATQLDEHTGRELKSALASDILDAREVGGEYRSAVRDANRAAELFDLIGSEAPVHTEAARAELLELMERNHRNPEFTKRLFTELGGRGSMDAMASIARLGLAVDDELGLMPGLGEQLRRLQTEMGVALATATNPASPFSVQLTDPATGELTEWMREFQRAGQEQFSLGLPGFEPYGYQLLGATMNAGIYSGEFLNIVGEDMIEMDARGLFEANLPSGLSAGYELNMINGVSAGFDPLNGLMVAMEASPEAAAEFFDPSRGTGIQVDGKDVSRIEYLLDRGQWRDAPYLHRGDYEDPSQRLVIDALASASNGAERGTVGYQIAEHAIKHVGSLDPDAVGLVNDASRESMGKLLEGQLGTVREVFAPGYGVLGDAAGVQLNLVLGDVAASPEAYARLVNAERAYSAAIMHEAAKSGSTTAITDQAWRTGGFQAQLDRGRELAIETEWMGKEDIYNERVSAVGGVGGYALSKTVSVVPLGGLAADGVNAVTSGALTALVEGSKVDYAAHAGAEVAQMYGDSRRELIRMTEAFLWDNQMYETSKPVPDELLRAGKPIPLAELRGTVLGHTYDSWTEHNSAYSDSAGSVLRKAATAYTNGAVEAEQSQRGGL